MDPKLVENLDELKWQHRTDRTKEIIQACEFYVTALTCTKCKTLNDRKSNYCSVCGEPLSDVAQEKEKVKVLLDTIIMNDDRYKKILMIAEEIANSSK